MEEMHIIIITPILKTRKLRPRELSGSSKVT